MLKCQYYLSIKTANYKNVCKNGLLVALAHFMIRRVTNIIFLNLKNKQMAKASKTAVKVSITPLHDRVIVKPAAAETKTAGGIIIPDTAKEKPQRGTVIAVGAGKTDEPMTVKVGDMVLYGKYAGTEIALEMEDLLIMRESDILAII